MPDEVWPFAAKGSETQIHPHWEPKQALLKKCNGFAIPNEVRPTFPLRVCGAYIRSATIYSSCEGKGNGFEKPAGVWQFFALRALGFKSTPIKNTKMNCFT